MKVLIVCGGTAGHIFPGLALAQELKKEDTQSEIILVVSARARDKEYLQVARPFLENIRVKTIISTPMPYKFSFQTLFFAVKLFWAFLQSLLIIVRARPDVVVGFGGYVSFAPLIIARLLGIPTLIHEQNIVPGRANQYLARLVDRVAISFKDTQQYFRSGLKEKIVQTGLPLRADVVDAMHIAGRHQFKPNKEKFTILVAGGSQGAHNVNELIVQSLRRMSEDELKKMRIIHLAGKKDYQYVRGIYETLPVESMVFDFLEDMASVYRIANILICRSGASTIFEAAFFGIPCVVIPYAYGTAHQKENAAFLQRIGAALVLDEQDTRIQDLQKIVRGLMADKKKRNDLSNRINMLCLPHARRSLKEQVFTLHRGS